LRILGIDTSCDDTAAAVVEDGTRVLSNVVNLQHSLHEPFGGVVPEIAARAHVERVLSVVDEALNQAGVSPGELSGVAVTVTPGLIGALLVGVTAAKALCWALKLPLVAVDHLQAHIYAAWLAGNLPQLPAVSLVVSGGHTSLFLTRGPTDHALLGRTVDDAAGEAFDKVASMLKLGYPGGPAIEAAAAKGNRGAVDFPRSRLEPGSCDFSFSGLKTAVLYHCLGTAASRRDLAAASYEPEFVADVAASFQEAVVDVLVSKTFEAAERLAVASVIVGGGVAANGRLRARLRERAEELGLRLYLAPRELCTDNAAMVAGLGSQLLEQGRTAPLDVQAQP